MAIDQTDVALNLGSKIINASIKFLEALEALEILEAQRIDTGIVLGDFDTDYENSSIKHVDGASLIAVTGTSIPAIRTFIDTGNHNDNLQDMRP